MLTNIHGIWQNTPS